MSAQAGAGPVTEVVVATTRVDAAVAALGAFDLVEVGRVELSAEEASALVGAAVPGPGVRLASSFAPDRATVLVLGVADEPVPVTGWGHGPRALDIYSADLDRSLEIARSGGQSASPEAVLAGGPMRMRQSLVQAAGTPPVVLVDSTHRRSSVCDLPDAPLHSEPHSVVWCVGDHAAELARWVAAGWTAGPTINFSEPSVSDELDLPERPTPITMSMLSDPGVAPVRVELLTFDDHADHADVGGPGAAGPAPIVALTVAVRHLGDAVAAWGDGAAFGPSFVRGDGRTASLGVTGGGVRLLLVERS